MNLHLSCKIKSFIHNLSTQELREMVSQIDEEVYERTGNSPDEEVMRRAVDRIPNVFNCICKDSTGWTEMPCCNDCGKQVEGK